ncbi:hypothetical protein HZA57_05655 [Candidatus Poribacteria bacterium]|nr:hypothetical protein [Candidatus Poribacteria bacterium]
MIAFICRNWRECQTLAETLGETRRTVDGPFRLWCGRFGGERPCRVYQAPGGADAHYAAGRLAHRRGAEILIHVGRASASRRLIREGQIEPGEAVMISAVTDLSPLKPTQQLTPANARRVPVALPDPAAGPTFELEADESLPRLVLGTVAIPLTSAVLGQRIDKQLGIGLFDLEALGVARAARETGLPGVVFKIVTGEVSPAWIRSRERWNIETRHLEALRELARGLP